MKPPIIIKILIKAIIPPIIAMFILSKWNFCEYITFIPEDHCFESGLALYLAILEAVPIAAVRILTANFPPAFAKKT